MSVQVQLRRGSTADNDSFIGANGELVVDTTKKDLRVHDGTTAGGTLIPNLLDVINAIYPVGSLYFGNQSTCPLAAITGTWELVSAGKAIWTGDGSNGGTTISAGLPEIKGSIVGIAGQSGSVSATDGMTVSQTGDLSYTGGGSASYWLQKFTIGVKASESNAIYGNSTTVQPPAYVVNVWRRTA